MNEAKINRTNNTFLYLTLLVIVIIISILMIVDFISINNHLTYAFLASFGVISRILIEGIKFSSTKKI